jgi:glycosyltransferase involved in cell wall biosynthesis
MHDKGRGGYAKSALGAALASMPTVSVVVPTYKRARLLKDALGSVFDQTYQDLEVIVVDDCSSDGGASRRVVESFPDKPIRLIELTRNRGPAGARNEAVKVATGAYISFLDSDDLWMPMKLEKQIAILQADAQVGMVYSDEFQMYPDGSVSSASVWAHREPPLPSGFIAKSFFMESFIATMTVTVRTHVLREVNGFDEAMLQNEDDDLWIRIMLKCKVICSDYPAGIRRIHQSNMSHDRDVMTYHQFLCIEKYIRTSPDFMREVGADAYRRMSRLLWQYLTGKIRKLSLPRTKVVAAYLHTRRKLDDLLAG